MNGIVEISIKGKKHRLRFNVQAFMEFEPRVLKANHLQGTSAYNTKVMTDLVYCGLFGEKLRSDQPIPTYDEFMDLFEEFSEEPDFAEQLQKVSEAFGESKRGKGMIEYGQEIAKKKAQESQQEEVNEQ